MEILKTLSERPISLLQIEAYKPESNFIYLTYQKYKLKVSESNRVIVFCCLFDSRHIATSTLVHNLTANKIGRSQIKMGESFPKSQGVNCYSFATGRSPLGKADDPVPGAFLIEEIRQKVLQELKIQIQPKISASELLAKNYDIDFLKNGLALSPTNKFTQAFFGKHFENLEKTESTLLMDFLTKGYQVPENTPYLSREVTDRLLQLDGLIKIYPECDKRDLSDCEFGRVFLAAFVNPKSDYHFMRYFKDGWYERVGDQIRKRPNMQAEIPFPKNDKEMLLGFKSLENDNDLEDFQFVGYYVVPTTVVLADKIGRKYILEHHKV